MMYTGVPEIAQKVFEGDVVFSILIGRFFLDQSKSPSKTFWVISGTTVYIPLMFHHLK